MRLIPGCGPTDAKIVLIGEAPGKVEHETYEPFSGMSGNLLNQWWAQVGLSREQIRIDNLYPFLPPGGKIERVPVDELAYYVYDLRKRLARLDGPHVIVPTGNYATFSLVGKGKVKAALRKALGEDIDATTAEKKAGITKLRGSVYPYTGVGGHNCKVIPTIHPAWFLYAGGFNSKKQRRAIADWRRIRREADTPIYNGAERLHITNPSVEEIESYLGALCSPEAAISIDIETWGNKLSCVGFGISDALSITIPLVGRGVSEKFLPYVKAICESPSAKVTQGGHYDAYWLAYAGITLNNWQWDTLAMHHCLHPTDEHSLHYLASIYCEDYRYWKDEAKDADEIFKYTKDLDALWTYNGMDCCYTRELLDALHNELVDRGMCQFYQLHYADLFSPVLGVMVHGVKVNTEAQKDWNKRLRRKNKETKQILEGMAGMDLFAKKDFSPKLLREYFNKVLKAPKVMSWSKSTTGKKKTQSLDEAALRSLATRVGKATGQTKKQFEETREAARLILKWRRDKKVSDFMKGAWDKDGRIRCQYKFQTEAGRFASSKNPKRTGYNLQNVDREIRDTFVPDEGSVFVKVDLSQIEDRIVKMWTQSPRLVELANLHPTEYDCHSHNAAIIFKKSESDVTYKERYLAKRGVHAAERGMGGKKLSEELLKDFDSVVGARECQRMIDTFFAEFHEIPEIYFKEIRQKVMSDKQLANNWGREWHCTYDRFSDDLYRRAYSFNPQSDAADLLNQWGLKPLHSLLQGMQSKLNLQVHDELIISCPPGEAYTVAAFLVGMLERPRYYFGNKLIVPACVTVAKSWKCDKYEFKRLPAQKEFNEAVYAVLEETNQTD